MNAYDFSAVAIDGQPLALSAYSGHYTLIVNVASKCGFTPQYEGLEALYRRFHARGFSILGFPCDQFGHQEPGSEAEILSFCSTSYGVSFPMASKIEVNGPSAHPLYAHLRQAKPSPVAEEAKTSDRLYGYLAQNKPELLAADLIHWNFTKFLIGPDGTVLRRYEPTVTPEQIGAELDGLLPAA